MSARILVVDDEPDLKALVLQKFRQQIRDGTVDFLFAHDGVEALSTLKANGGIDVVVTDIKYAEDGWARAPAKATGERRKHIDDYRFSLWRHGQYPHRDEPWRI